jgi:hypothetical protein|tara:strand:+ start:1090 stop:1383 length:294 start_codon:yes stop_codon:yes gene_type:complete
MADFRSKQVITLGGGTERFRLPIYYLKVEVAYFKAKGWRKIDTWIVTFVEDHNRILKDDIKTNSRLNEELYGSKFKGQRGLRIDRVHSRKRIGTTNW